MDAPQDWVQPELPLSAGRIVWWMGFTPNTTDDEARAKFIAKYHYEPRIRRDDAGVYAGPIEEEHGKEEAAAS
jgi:hypothetical protein